MRLGEILLARGLISEADVEEAMRRQKIKGGRLGDNLVRLGVLTHEQLDEVIHETPKTPKSLAEVGVPQALLSSLLLKFMYLEQHETIDLARLDRLQLFVHEGMMTGGLKAEHAIGEGVQ